MRLVVLERWSRYAYASQDRRRGECGVNLRRDGRVVECGGLENRCPAYAGPGVRTPLSPQSQSKPSASRRMVFIFRMTEQNLFCEGHDENKNTLFFVSKNRVCFGFAGFPKGARERSEQPPSSSKGARDERSEVATPPIQLIHPLPKSLSQGRGT